MPLSRPRTKLHPTAPIQPVFGGRQAGVYFDLQVWGFAVHNLPGCASRLVILGAPFPAGGLRGSPGPPGDGCWWGKGRLCPLCPIPLQVAVEGEGWSTGALSLHWAGLEITGSAATEGWAVGLGQRRSTGLDVAEVGAYFLPNSSFFPGLISSCPWVSSAWLGKGCSGQLCPSGLEQEGRWDEGIVVGCFREARGRAVARLSLAVAHTVEKAVSQFGASHPHGAGGGRV